MDVEIRGVDDEVGLGSQGLERLAFRLDHLREGARHDVLERVTTPARFVAAHENFGRRIEENQLKAFDLLSQITDQGHDDLVLSARANDQRQAITSRPGTIGKLGHLRDERRRKIVHDEPAEILEVVSGRRATGTGHPGNNDDFAHVASDPVSALSATRSNSRGVVRTTSCSYSPALAMKPGGGAGSRISRSTSPASIRPFT